MWHIDSYDKLKPYEICINGPIDGFSRFVLWMHAYHTNSDPKVVAGYFIEEVQRRMGAPTRIRCDFGTENKYVEYMQKFLRYDHADNCARRCLIYGSSNRMVVVIPAKATRPVLDKSVPVPERK